LRGVAAGPEPDGISRFAHVARPDPIDTVTRSFSKRQQSGASHSNGLRPRLLRSTRTDLEYP
jgi:hypothetical protein